MINWTHLLLALPAIAYAGGSILQDESSDYSVLGTNNMSEIEYEMEFDVDVACYYTLHVSFKHQPEFFVGTKDTCRSGVDDLYDGHPALSWKDGVAGNSFLCTFENQLELTRSP
jgi:hypothetical protein